jgi:hypothetical protein
VTEFLYRLLEDNWRHARLAEDRRIVITGVNVIAATAMQIAIFVLAFSPRTLLLTVWIVVLGLYGCLACLRLEERAQFHTARARKLRQLIDDQVGVHVNELLADSDRSLSERHRKLSGFRMHHALMGINVATLIAGLVYLAFAILG